MVANTGTNRTEKSDYGPLTGFYDPSKIGSSYSAPPLTPVANVAAGYSPPTTIGSTPAAAPPPPPTTTTSVIDSGYGPSDPGLTDIGNPNTGNLWGLTGLDNPSTDPTGTGGGTSGGGGGAGSWIDQFINGITGGQGLAGSLGSMAPFLADYYLAQKQADKQQGATDKTIQPLFDQAHQYLDAATKDLKLYESGTVNPAQKAMIDQYSVSQKAQIAQQLQSQGISDSGALNSAYQQIDNNAMIMKQNFVQQSLSNALALEGAGMQPLLVAIQDKLLSDTELAKTMMELTGTLASAWAYQQGQAARGGGGGSAAGGAAAGGGLGSLINKGINWAGSKISGWLGGSGGGTGVTAEMEGLPAGAFPAEAGDIAAGSAGADVLGAGAGGAAGAAGGAAAGAAGGAAAAGGGGLLPGSIAGADMVDTAAYAPSAIEATTPGSGALASAAAPVLGVGFALALASAIKSDNAAAKPMAQMAVLAQNGAMGQAMAKTMIATASKYGDPNNPASWDLTKWSPEDQKAFNYGHITDPQAKTGSVHVFTKDQM